MPLAPAVIAAVQDATGVWYHEFPLIPERVLRGLGRLSLALSMIVLLRGGGDLASGVAYRLHRAGLSVVITEIAQPLMVRRTVSFGEAVYRGATVVEGITARLVAGSPALEAALSAGEIPVLVDPDASIIQHAPSRDSGRRAHDQAGAGPWLGRQPTWSSVWDPASSPVRTAMQ